MTYRLGIASYHSHCFTHFIRTICDIKVSKESMSVAPPYYLDSSFTSSKHHPCLSHLGSPGLSCTFPQLFFVLPRAPMCRAQDGSEKADTLNTRLATCIGDCGLPGPFRCVGCIRSQHTQFYLLSL